MHLSKLKKYRYILFLLAGIFISTNFFAQVGGRKKEHKNQSKRAFSLFKGKRRAGNAHIFARGGRHSKSKSGAKWTMKHFIVKDIFSPDKRSGFFIFTK